MFAADGAGLFAARDASGAALDAGIRSGRTEEVRRLLQSGVTASSVHLYHAYQELHADWSSDRDVIVRLLHKHRASFGSRFEPFHDPDVLVHAIKEGNDAVVKLLVERGADANVEGKCWVPLQSALWHGDQSIVRTLLNAGASVDERASLYDEYVYDEMTPLLYAASEGLAMSVRLLLQRGASVDEVDKDGETALMHAVRAYTRDLECITLLIDAGSPIDAKSCRGHTALMLAASSGRVETVALLLEREASVDVVNRHNWTALMFAVMYGSMDVVKILMDAGSPVNVVDVSGDTALMAFARRKPDEKFACDPEQLRETIKLFLNYGASIDQVNNQSFTALMIAAYHGNDQIVRVLLELNASLDDRVGSGDTALSLAQRAKHDKVISLLVEHAAFAGNATIHDGIYIARSPDDAESLFKAAMIKDDAAALRLLQAQVPINKQTPTGETALMRAVWNRQLQIVGRLIDHGANLELMDDDKWSALMIAAHVGDSDSTRLLAQAGASLDTIGNGNDSALMRAASKGHEDVVNVLIEKGASVDLEKPRSQIFQGECMFGTDLGLMNPTKQVKSWSALMYAASNGFESIVKILIEARAVVNPCVVSESDTPLICAARNGHEGIVRMLISRGAQVNKANDKALECALRNRHQDVARILIDKGAKVNGRNGKDVLSCAASYGCEDILAMLLHSGAAMNECDGSGKTLLMHAAGGGHEHCVRLLLAAGASVNCRAQKQWNALMVAARGGHNGCLVELLKSGADVNAQTEDGYTALIIASQEGNATAVQYLLSSGAATEIICSGLNDRTALIVAASEGFDSIVRLLLQAKCAIAAKGSDGECALWQATVRRRGDVIKTLLESGASVNVADNKGQTPLMIAAEENYEEGIRILLDAGANIDAVDNDKFTAIMRAAMKGQSEIVGFLRDQGASLDIRNKDGRSVLLLACGLEDNAVIRKLLVVKRLLNESVAYLRAGATQRELPIEQSTLSIRALKSSTITNDLTILCDKMRGASAICRQVCTRLSSVEKQLDCMAKIARRGPMRHFTQILERTRGFLMKFAGKATIIHLVSNDQIVSACRRTHEDLDEFILAHDLALAHNTWEKQLAADTGSYKLSVEKSVQMDQTTLFEELENQDAQQEALILILFECENRKSKYTKGEMQIMHRIFRYVSSSTKLKIASVPKWFVPSQDVEINKAFTSGSYGSVHIGRWNGMQVIVKCALSHDARSQAMFLQEADIWHKLKHQNIIELYRACHVGEQFFVCELATEKTLCNFLYGKDQATVWEKLLEAARGLRYLHEEHKVVHGDLKCNNILVCSQQYSKTKTAKLADFGLSFVVSSRVSDSSIEEVGAIEWKAPEVIAGSSRGSFASDVYSFGMCIFEAINAVERGGTPWGNFIEQAVKYKVLKAKQLPKRPVEATDAQWNLITHMCKWEPSERPSMKYVVDVLEAIVLQ